MPCSSAASYQLFEDSMGIQEHHGQHDVLCGGFSHIKTKAQKVRLETGNQHLVAASNILAAPSWLSAWPSPSPVMSLGWLRRSKPCWQRRKPQLWTRCYYRSLFQERKQLPIHTYPLSLTACCKCLGLVVQPSKLGQPTSQGPMLVDDVQKFIGFHSTSILVVSLWIFHHIFIFFSSYRASPFIFSNIPTSESSALARPGFAAPSVSKVHHQFCCETSGWEDMFWHGWS